MPKHVKGGTLGVFEHPFFCKIDKKMTGGPFGDIWEKKSHEAEKKIAQKNFGQGRDSNPCPSAWQTSKKP